jgi:hypothetical protein
MERQRSSGKHGELSQRRLAKDYERKVQTGETLVEAAMIQLLLARLGQHPTLSQTGSSSETPL